MQKQSSRGFTFVEIIIVVMIMTILSTIGLSTYASVQVRSRDTKRKTDVELVRSALEQYRSNNDAYPTGSGSYGLPFGSGDLSDGGGNTYMDPIPDDPRSGSRHYSYTSTDGSDYEIKVDLERAQPTPCALPTVVDECGTGFNCNFCYNSLGQQ